MNDVRLTNFLGISFGSSPETARKKLLSKSGYIYDIKNSSKDVLFFNGPIFNGQNRAMILLYFVNNKFCKSTAYIKPEHDAFAIQNYKEIQNELNLKYFIVNDNLEIYKSPYQKNDEYTETGILLEKVQFSSRWNFPSINGTLEDFISLKIAKDFTIVMNYEDGNLSNSYPLNDSSEAALRTCFFLVSFILFLYIFAM